MADEFCFALLKASTLRILQAAGFESGQGHATHVLTNVFEQYLELLSTTASAYSQLSSRSVRVIYDVLDTFEALAIDLPNLKNWLEQEAESLSPSWTEQDDPSRILKDEYCSRLLVKARLKLVFLNAKKLNIPG